MAVISLDIHIDNLETVLALFDRIQVWRSATELGVYSEITAVAATAAELDGTVVGPWDLNGKALDVVLNTADPVAVNFIGGSVLNLAEVIQQINDKIPALASEAGAGTNKLRLTSPTTGTGSSLLVSDLACAILGLPTTKTNGKAARIVVASPTEDYEFRDYDGLSTYWYKTRYYSTLTQSVSSFSDSRQGSPQVVLPDGLLSQAKIWLANGAGQPIVDRRIIFVAMEVLQVAVDSKNYGILPGADRVNVVTDSTGYAELKLARGARFRVFFEGSNYFREFVVPDQTEFDLLQVLGTTADPFTIQQSPPMPIRVS